MNTPRVIDTYLVSDKRHVILFFADGSWQTYARVEVKPRTWLAQLWRNLQSWQWLPRIVRRVFT